MTQSTLRFGLAIGRGALGLSLMYACSAGGDAATEGAETSGSGTNTGVLEPVPPTAPQVNGGGNGPLGGGTINQPPTVGSEVEPVPVAIDPGSAVPPPVNVPDDATPPPGETVDEGETTPPPDVLEPGALIRGADPSVESATSEGPFDVSVISSGLRDGPDYGTQTLHVPVGAEPPFAGVVIVPGFVSPESSIRAWGPFLASHGIVTLTIGTNSGGDSPAVRSRALLDGIETLKAENARAGSPLESNMALDRFGVMGWSMGGGGTLIAANANPDLRAAVSLAAWSPGERFTENAVPTLLLAGSADPLAGGQSQGFFESMPESTPHMLFEVAGGPHDIANDPESADGEIGRYGLSWLKVFLEGDERYRQFLLETPSNQSDFRDNL